MVEPSSRPSALRVVARASSSLANGATKIAVLAGQLCEEMAQQWRNGGRPLAEDFLARHPDLRNHPTAAIQLICEEICLRQEHGEDLNAAAILLRFPQWRSQLEIMLECHRLLQAEMAGPAYPEVGELLGDFRLLVQLGQGGQGRVFLATQPSLADRPVVLKITSSNGQEHLALARLQHTHIVPLYLVQDDPDRRLRVLCMPYFGGASLAQLLDMLQGRPLAQRTGRDLLQTLDLAQGRIPIPCPTRGPARLFLSRGSYMEAVCWIGMCLADALHYAHERGLIHLDLKPSNVLLAADGQPMLLDFHLAREPLRPNDPGPEWFGGTPGYMSPEQQAALEAISAGQPVARGVDGRSDIYSLGLLLYEALSGKPPAETGMMLERLDRCNPQVSPGLADIIAQCLRPDPRDRYQDAGNLAGDLRRHLRHQPLVGVANRSWRERWSKWRRRRPQALTWLAVLTVVLAGLLAGGIRLGMSYRQWVREGETALIQGQSLMQDKEYAAAFRTFGRGLERVRDLPGCGDLVRQLEQQQDWARLGQLGDDLHMLADQIRFLYDAESLPLDRMRNLEAKCRSVWEAREAIWQRRSARAMDAATEQRLRTDLLDLAVLGTDLRVRLAPATLVATARQEALQTLAEAAQLLGSTATLEHERLAHARALGIEYPSPPPERLTPRSAWEHYSLGRMLLRHGNLREARKHFDQAVQLEPQGFWPNFYQGVCAYRQGNREEAILAFRVCIALAPHKPECYYNRALAYHSLQQFDNALRDYHQALRLQPTFAPALFSRGVLHCQEKRSAEALADLQHALAQGFDPALVHFNLAVVHEARQDRSQALAQLEQALRHRPGWQEAQEFVTRLRSSGQPPERPRRD